MLALKFRKNLLLVLGILCFFEIGAHAADKPQTCGLSGNLAQRLNHCWLKLKDFSLEVQTPSGSKSKWRVVSQFENGSRTWLDVEGKKLWTPLSKNRSEVGASTTNSTYNHQAAIDLCEGKDPKALATLTGGLDDRKFHLPSQEEIKSAHTRGLANSSLFTNDEVAGFSNGLIWSSTASSLNGLIKIFSILNPKSYGAVPPDTATPLIWPRCVADAPEGFK